MRSMSALSAVTSRSVSTKPIQTADEEVYSNIELTFDEHGVPYNLCGEEGERYGSKYNGAHKFLRDRVSMYLKGGKGGVGSATRIGGRGGSVWVSSNPAARLSALPTTVAGLNGKDASKDHIITPAVEDSYINVPLGTVVYLQEGRSVCPITTNDTTRLTFIGELNNIHEKMLLCTGGLGGSIAHEKVGDKVDEKVDGKVDEWSSSCSGCSTRQYPGLAGEMRRIVFELKSIGDVGLAGLPNSGKSSMLHVVSKARPRIGHYPFTTLQPTLGHIDYGNDQIVTIADIPGIVEGAHQNYGLGHKFLKHIERTKALIYLVDYNGFVLNANDTHKTPLQALELIRHELVMHQKITHITRDITRDITRESPMLLQNKRCLIVVNKLDTPAEQALFNPLKTQIEALCETHNWHNVQAIIGISLKTGYNIPLLKQCIKSLVF